MINKFNIEVYNQDSDSKKINKADNYIWHLEGNKLSKDHSLFFRNNKNKVRSRCIGKGAFNILFGICLKITLKKWIGEYQQ
jgi:hypothetical protein